MPHLFVDQLIGLATAILIAAGTPEDIAHCLGRSLVESNLKGVDSHGVMRLEWYLEQIRERAILPAARPAVQMDQASSAIVAGNGVFGIYGMQIAADLAAAKARQH